MVAAVSINSSFDSGLMACRRPGKCNFSLAVAIKGCSWSISLLCLAKGRPKRAKLARNSRFWQELQIRYIKRRKRIETPKENFWLGNFQKEQYPSYTDIQRTGSLSAEAV
ncbi:hypothetical protein TWF970_001708 [Orbilia oligospora]|uniref:Uncharacterized protein n=1 Tax=Orbilia oligospora TaxID=2813651 RepID=A0A7C8VQI2_ORBOL|nr:hypothetical protein TWF970_001708 [Orbilia oligospora]